MCCEYVIEKADYKRQYQELRELGIEICELLPKLRSYLQKVFIEVRKKWVRDLKMDKDEMEVDEDKVTSKLNNNHLMKASLFHGEGGRAGLGG